MWDLVCVEQFIHAMVKVDHKMGTVCVLSSST
jgi:hypothetical protein